MNWAALFLSVGLVAPVVARAQQPSPNTANKESKQQAVTLRACVQQGTHGSIGNLSQIEAIAPGNFAEGRTVLYWFHKNVAAFKDQVGRLVEIDAVVAEVIEGPLELKATDGVFAEIQVPSASALASNSVPRAVGTSGNAPDVAVATAGAADAAEPEASPIVVKAEVSRLRMVGTCR